MRSNTSPNNFYEEYASTLKDEETASTLEVRVTDSLSGDYCLLWKRLLDLGFAFLLLPFAIILIFTFLIIIKLESRGPAFYFQQRVGLNGQYFKVIKLRSMRNDAEKNGAVWAENNDPRITRVGKFIRKTRIDELPQLINVIKGDMSVVGPRPERPMFTAEFEKEHPGFTRRLSVKPGLTGWAQVNGGYEITPLEKVELDVHYINNMNLKTDIMILLLTIKIVLTGHGAR
ncbi:sugar transferase [Sporosarcina sp. SAFN-015]|uniref:sugar transferase n=1 Tax=Sporosarcina sp. SAFN-015 TaxID=3387274 RepID=UPI003F7E3486